METIQSLLETYSNLSHDELLDLGRDMLFIQALTRFFDQHNYEQLAMLSANLRRYRIIPVAIEQGLSSPPRYVKTSASELLLWIKTCVFFARSDWSLYSASSVSWKSVPCLQTPGSASVPQRPFQSLSDTSSVIAPSELIEPAATEDTQSMQYNGDFETNFLALDHTNNAIPLGHINPWTTSIGHIDALSVNSGAMNFTSSLDAVIAGALPLTPTSGRSADQHSVCRETELACFDASVNIAETVDHVAPVTLWASTSIDRLLKEFSRLPGAPLSKTGRIGIVNGIITIVREDLEDLVARSHEEWRTVGIWKNAAEVELVLDGNAMNRAATAYRCLSQIGFRQASDLIRERIALINLYYAYETASNEFNAGTMNVSFSSGPGKGYATTMIDLILPQVFWNWEHFSEHEKARARKKFHLSKRYGKRWDILVREVGAGVLLLSSEAADKLNKNTAFNDNMLETLAYLLRAECASFTSMTSSLNSAALEMMKAKPATSLPPLRDLCRSLHASHRDFKEWASSVKAELYLLSL